MAPGHKSERLHRDNNILNSDEDTLSAVSEETTTLLTRSTNSSISNLSFDSKNSQK